MSKKGHRGIFQSTFTTSNTIFVGLPVTMALFGEEAIPYTLLYFFANTTFFWTLGNACIQADSKEFSYQQMFTLKTLRRIFSPPILGFLASLIILILNINSGIGKIKDNKYMLSGAIINLPKHIPIKPKSKRIFFKPME